MPRPVRLWMRGRFAPLVAAIAATLAIAALSTLTSASPSEDFKLDFTPPAYAIKGARIVPGGTGKAIENGTVVVRNGVIAAVGPADAVAIPADAEVIEGKGLIVYPGFIDLYTSLGQATGAVRSRTGAGRTSKYSDYAYPRTPVDDRNGITPEFDLAGSLDLPDATADERRKLGFTSLIAAPGGAIATGQGALVSLSGLPRREVIVKSPTGLHINLAAPFEPSPPTTTTTTTTPNDFAPGQRRRGGGGGAGPRYPLSLMGIVAHLRQAMLDAEHLQALKAEAQARGGPRPPFDPALVALAAARSRLIPVWWEANARDEIHRALDLAEEFGTDSVIVGGREASKVVDRLKSRRVPVALRIDFPEEPKLPSEAEYRKKADEQDRPLRVQADRLKRWKERAGTASVLAKAGVKFGFSTDGISRVDTFLAQVRRVISAGLPADAALDALTTNAAEIAGVSARLGSIETGKLGHLTVLTAPLADEKAKVRYVLADGLKFDMEKSTSAATKKGFGGRGGFGGPPGKSDENVPAKPEPPAEEKPEGKGRVRSKGAQAKPDAKAKDVPKGKEQEKEVPKAKDEAAKKAEPKPEPFVDIRSELDEDRIPTSKTGGNVLIKDAIVLTVTKGSLPKASILVKDGKIAAVGADLAAPEGVKVIDAKGLVVMPGIIDSHSHMAIQGGVNEMSLSIVPEVRVLDVVTGDEPTIYRALAGGTTAARLLHGSANTIGGQDAVIKLKHGLPARELIVRDRTQGVKFALGENVTRSTGRFPNTRMGVEAVIERAFEEGRAYANTWKAYRETLAKSPAKAGPAPRRDLRLEALAGILDGSIKIHSHCYRNDEILMLLRATSKYGVHVQSLQHVLEGYKVAPELAAYGVSASTFSDWWAYKIEAYDAIPFNAALLTEAGVTVCIKSDSEELVRHLYLEAAKMVKYGAVTEAQALAMITINPAKEVGIAHRTGSIEVGKDADLAIFNAHPFDSFARCELTLVEGEVRFQRDHARDARPVARPGDHARVAISEARSKSLDLAIDNKGIYAITGATLHPVTGQAIEGGTLVVADGKIQAIGASGTAIPAGAKTIDAKGLHVWPGMIDAGDEVGLFEIGSIRETQDFSDSAQYQPELRSSTALHPDSELIPVTRANGVLSSFVQPTGGVIAGQGAVIRLDGWVPSEMVVQDRAALVINIPAYRVTDPDAPRRGFGGFGQGGADGGDPNARRKETLDAIKDQFKIARLYESALAAAKEGKAPTPTPDPRLAALQPYLKGERPVIFVANQKVEILDAIKLAQELKVKAIVSGGRDAWKVAPALAKAKMPVIVAGVLYSPESTTDPYDAPYANPARLHEAGVEFAIRSAPDGDAGTAVRNLPYEAATAVAFGLPEDAAVKAVTIAPARILGVADKLGSLEPGKQANLVITAGHLLQATTEVKGLFIAGKPLTPESKQTKLYEKYRKRLADVRAGKAPLGIETTPAPTTTPPAPAPAATGGSGR